MSVGGKKGWVKQVFLTHNSFRTNYCFKKVVRKEKKTSKRSYFRSEKKFRNSEHGTRVQKKKKNKTWFYTCEKVLMVEDV